MFPFLARAPLTYYIAVYRTNTFPLIHAGLFHAFLNTIALVPLLERFETEHGTLTSLLLFFGRELPEIRPEPPQLTIIIALSTIPAIIYVVLERGVLRGNTAVLGARYVHKLLCFHGQVLIPFAVYGCSYSSGWRRSRHIGRTPISKLGPSKYRHGQLLWCSPFLSASWLKTRASLAISVASQWGIFVSVSPLLLGGSANSIKSALDT